MTTGEPKVAVTPGVGTELPATTYGVQLANASYEWYRSHAIQARHLYRGLEVALLVLAASIPASAVVFASAAIPAVIGSIVVVLTGMRSVFHWQENYVRFSQAREAVEAERRSYGSGAPPYDNEATRDQVLAATVSRIEQEELRGWVKIAAELPKA
jgi:hypothetical protein